VFFFCVCDVPTPYLLQKKLQFKTSGVVSDGYPWCFIEVKN